MKNYHRQECQNIGRCRKICHHPAGCTLQIGFHIKEDGDHKKMLKHHQKRQANRRIFDPQIQIPAELLPDHEDAPGETKGTEGEIPVIHLPQNKPGYREKKQTEETNQSEQQNPRHGIPEEQDIEAVIHAVGYGNTVGKTHFLMFVGIFHLQDQFGRSHLRHPFRIIEQLQIDHSDGVPGSIPHIHFRAVAALRIIFHMLFPTDISPLRKNLSVRCGQLKPDIFGGNIQITPQLKIYRFRRPPNDHPVKGFISQNTILK